jgi:hypothetical protein
VPTINVANFVAETTAEFQRGLTLDLTPWGSHKVRIYGKAKPKKVRGDLIKPKNSLMVSPVQFDGRTYEEHRNVVTHMARELEEGRGPLSMEDLAEHERSEAKPSPSYVDPPWPAERREAQDRGAIAELMRAILRITLEENQE